MTVRRVKESFAATDADGNMVTMTAGTLVETDKYPGYEGREHLFEDVDTYVARQEENKKAQSTKPVETATAEPGEQRNVSTKREFKPPTTK